jgi:hypothetical protein
MLRRSGGSHLALNASFDMLASLEVYARMRDCYRAFEIWDICLTSASSVL